MSLEMVLGLVGSALPCVAQCCSVLQWVAVCCSVLQCVAVCPVCCSVLQCAAVRIDEFINGLWTSG